MKTQVNLKALLQLQVIVIVFICFEKANAQVLPEYSAFPSYSIGVQVSTQGTGLQASSSIAKAFNIRLGFNFVPGVTVQYNSRDLSLNRTSVYAIGDWQPLYGGGSWLQRKWFISTGFGYYFSNTLNRQGYGNLPDYSIYMSKLRPYIGTGLGNVRLKDNIRLRFDFGEFIPTSAPTSTYENKANTITNGLRGILPGLNTAVTLYYRF